MATMRDLPTRRNPLITPESAPSYEELVNLRRLGRTRLTVKPGQVGTSNATKAENLGPIEYAHLRAPLPEDLNDSEIFSSQSGQASPETYFFMRRSKDGYVSASGMFKIAFPWATMAEERAERNFLKNLEVTSADEVAGNVWVTAEYALDLAQEYGLSAWIRALLDPAEIHQGTTSPKKPIAEPPKFDIAVDDQVKLAPPTKASRARSTRSMSPAKGTPSKVKSPRKRQTKAQKEAILAQANAASASLQSALDDAASVADEATPAPELSTTVSTDVASSEVESKTDAEVTAAPTESVTVEVDQAVEVNGDTEVTHTNVTITMPAGLPELPLPEDTEAMLEKAKQMVEEARALEAAGEGAALLPKTTRKRKAEDVDLSDIDKELPTQPAKKAKVLEEKLKREKVRNRAIVGVTAMLGIAPGFEVDVQVEIEVEKE